MTATTQPKLVGDLAADLVRAYGADHFFLLTGGDNAFLLSLRDRGIEVVLARSERSAAFMADAYARLTGKPTFVYGQFGPGALVVLSGLVDALYAKSPVVVLASDTKTDVRHRFAYQELDQTTLFGAVAKWAARLERGDRLPDMLRTAVREAVSGSPGPTYLGLPNDLLLEQAPEIDLYADPSCMLAPAHRVRPSANAVDRLAEAFRQARRPVLLCGTGVIIGRAWDEATRFAETHSIPVVTSLGGKGSIAETHHLAHGVVGRYSRRSANEIVQQADLVLVVGSRLNDMTTDRGKLLTGHPLLAHVDIDASALGRTQSEEISAVGDATSTFNDLVDALDGGPTFDDWAAQAAALTRDWLRQRERIESEQSATLSPLHVVAALREVLGPDDIVVSDTGYSAAWTGALYDVRQPGPRHLRTAGSLGWSLPASLGAQLAVPGSRVVCVIGDGGIGYHLAEIETAVRLRLPVVIVLLNNGTLAFEYHVQSRILGTVDPSLIDFSAADYAGVARSLGAFATSVTETSQLAGALQTALESNQPALLDVRVTREAEAPVTNYDHLRTRSL